MKSFILITSLILISGNILLFSCNNNETDKKINNENKLEIPKIDFIEMSSTQPHEKSTKTIWYDDFSSEKSYMESKGNIDNNVKFGTTGGSMDAGFDAKQVSGHGNRKVAFGDFPNSSVTEKKGEKYDEVYWRLYVKHEHGWEGSPKKMSRATSIVSNNWQQAMIAHVWSGNDSTLTLDPARGIYEQTSQIKTTSYNDFDNLKWLGNSPSAKYPIFATKESGYWVLVESRAKLNTPGKSDGINQLWIDGRLEAERNNLNFRGSYNRHGINAVFLESYWNEGSVKAQGRWYDNFVISTEPIGPVVCPANPTLHKTQYCGPEEQAGWEVEIASDYNGTDVVFKSTVTGKTKNVTVNQSTGSFSGSLATKSVLASGTVYFCRVRQQSTNGDWSGWSRWHQGFKVE